MNTLREKRLMKIGERRQKIIFKLGTLKVAEVYYCLSYGVGYVPKLKQYCDESTWLTTMTSGQGERANYKTVDQAIEKLKELAGKENFARLTRHDGKVFDDIKEKEVQSALWGEV
jgi:hypothetical protein